MSLDTMPQVDRVTAFQYIASASYVAHLSMPSTMGDMSWSEWPVMDCSFLFQAVEVPTHILDAHTAAAAI